MTYHPETSESDVLHTQLTTAGWEWAPPDPVLRFKNANGTIEVHPRSAEDSLLVMFIGSGGGQDEVHVELDGKVADFIPVLNAEKDGLTVETFAGFVAKVKAVCPRSVAFVDRN